MSVSWLFFLLYIQVLYLKKGAFFRSKSASTSSLVGIFPMWKPPEEYFYVARWARYKKDFHFPFILIFGYFLRKKAWGYPVDDDAAALARPNRSDCIHRTSQRAHCGSGLRLCLGICVGMCCWVGTFSYMETTDRLPPVADDSLLLPVGWLGNSRAILDVCVW